MEKQTKNIITRAWVEKELRFYNTADFRFGLVIGGILTVLSAVACLLPCLALCQASLPIVLNVVLCLLLGGAFLAIFFCFTVKNIVKRVLERRLLDRGAFGVVVRTVQYKTEKLEYGRRTGRRSHLRMKEVLVFDEFGEIEVGHTEYQFAEAGDEYYMVVYYTPKPKMRLWYSCKTHEYREN